MTTKLNLTIEENVAKQIKLYAEKKKISVSKITEEYYNQLLTEKKAKRKKGFVESAAGIIKDISINDIEKERDEYLKKKYGL